MVIDWLGHACFKVTLKNGTIIVFDPYDDQIGYTPQDIKADIVTISHGHGDHSDLSHITGNYTVIREPGEHTFGELTIHGIKTWHDKKQGALRGENICFMLSVNGIRLCHMKWHYHGC